MTISRNRRFLTATAAVSAVTLFSGAAVFAFDPPVSNPPQQAPPPVEGAPPATANPPATNPDGTTPQTGTGTATNSTQAATPNDLITVASKDPSMTTFVRLLRESGLSPTLSGSMSGPYTVFAPTNSAFSRIPAETMTWLERPENKASLVVLLKNHIVNGKLMRDNLRQSSTPVVLKTLAGTTLSTTYRTQSSMPSINGANLRGGEVPADNGVLHEVDTVIIPPTTAFRTGAGADTGTAASASQPPATDTSTPPANPPGGGS